jgi:hypothetical protein
VVPDPAELGSSGQGLSQNPPVKSSPGPGSFRPSPKLQTPVASPSGYANPPPTPPQRQQPTPPQTPAQRRPTPPQTPPQIPPQRQPTPPQTPSQRQPTPSWRHPISPQPSPPGRVTTGPYNINAGFDVRVTGFDSNQTHLEVRNQLIPIFKYSRTGVEWIKPGISVRSYPPSQRPLYATVKYATLAQAETAIAATRQTVLPDGRRLQISLQGPSGAQPEEGGGRERLFISLDLFAHLGTGEQHAAVLKDLIGEVRHASCNVTIYMRLCRY